MRIKATGASAASGGVVGTEAVTAGAGEPDETHALLTPKRLRVWAAAMAVAFWLPVLGAPIRGFFDFSAFYAAGALVGHTDLSRLYAVVEYERQNGLQPVPFLNPPAYALLYAPFTNLPFGIAGYLSMAAMFALLLAAVEVGRRSLGIDRRLAVVAALAWSPAAAGVVSGQSSSLSLLLVVVTLVGLERRDGRGDLLAGAAVAALAYKPQLALPLFGLLLLRGNWRALLAGCVGIGGWYVIGTLATGGNWAWPLDWVDAIRSSEGINSATNDWQSISLPGLCARLAIPTQVGYALGGLMILWSLRPLRSQPLPAAVALACVLGLVVSPHAMIYEATLLLPALALVVGRERWVPVALYLVVAAWPLGALLGWQPMALVLPAFAWYLIARVLAGQPSATGLVRSGAVESSSTAMPRPRGLAEKT
jgi:hypothetical protein